MTPPASVFHNLLRPCILQVLRGTGYHAAKPAVVDLLTELTSRYLQLLCETTAQHAATHSPDAVPNLFDVRNAMEECGALPQGEQSGDDAEEMVESLMDGLVKWLNSKQYNEIRRVASDGDEDFTDYLSGTIFTLALYLAPSRNCHG